MNPGCPPMTGPNNRSCRPS